MRFAPSDDAVALRDMATRLLAAEAAPEVVRAGWPGGDRAKVDAVWALLGANGSIGTLVREADGGLGLDENEVVGLLEAIGYSGLPVPAVETIAVAAPLLAAAGDARLPEVLGGRASLTAALDGERLVPFTRTASLVVLGDAAAIRLYGRDELGAEPRGTIDGSRALAEVVRVTGPGRLLTDDPDAIVTAWRRGVLGTAALLVGLARRMLDLTVAYVKRREQYGVPVGSFQAIKHSLASAHLAVELSRPMVLAAAWELSTGGGGEPVSAAKVLASDAARLVARTAIQCHGAMGYTTEYDLHLFAKRVWALAPSWGDATSHRARLAEALGV